MDSSDEQGMRAAPDVSHPMSEWSFDAYWRNEFRGTARPDLSDLPRGWSLPTATPDWFVEPVLRLREGFGSESAPIRLIAAPGAVGKSTYASSMCSTLDLVLVDLAKTVTVGGNMFSGGLAKAGNGAFEKFGSGEIGVVFDALDEARLKVTEKSFFDFLEDVVAVHGSSSVPTVLLGRTGIVDDCWQWLAEHGVEAAIFDVVFFDKDRAIRFLETELIRLSEDARFKHLKASVVTHHDNYEELFSKLVDRLSSYDDSEGGEQRSLTFSGYAPVLQAVALMIAEGPHNPATINIAELTGSGSDFLLRVINGILDRESAKVRSALDYLDVAVRDVVYDPEEQRSRLCAVAFGTPPPSVPVLVPPEHHQEYIKSIDLFLGDHPFRDGARKVSSAVFEADLLGFGLGSADLALRGASEVFASNSSRPANPFLIDFYPVDATNVEPEGRIVVPPEHVGLLDASMRSRIGPNEIVSLDFLEDEEDDQYRADVRIAVYNATASRSIDSREFNSTSLGVLRLRDRVGNVTVIAPNLDVELGNGEVCTIGAPSTFDVDKLTIKGRDFSITRDRAVANVGDDRESDNEVRLDAKQAEVPQALPRLIGATLSVNWPGSQAYPWTAYHVGHVAARDPRLDVARRALRRLVLSFRSHSRGRLGRVEDKIEHARMTKGQIGHAIREKLVLAGVIQRELPFYYLDPTALGEVTGITYQSLKNKQFNERADGFLEDALAELAPVPNAVQP